MATYYAPGATKKKKASGTQGLEDLATSVGLDPEELKPKKSQFSELMDLLALPSVKTEEVLTGGEGYEASGLNAPSAFAARMVADPLNVLGPLGVGTKVAKGLGAVGKVATKIKPIGKLARAGEELFVPGAKVRRVSPQLAEELPALETSTKARQMQATRDVGKLGKEFSPEIRGNLGKLVERKAAGEVLTPEELQAVEKATGFIEKRITQPEVKAGVAPSLIADYFPRQVEREAVEKQLKFGGDRLSLGLGGAERTRKFVTQEAGEEAGVVYKNALEALAVRTSKSEAARANVGFIKRLIEGGVKDVDGNPLLAPIAKKGLAEGYEEFSLKGLKGFQAPKEAVKEIEKYYKTFISDDATNDLLRFYDGSLGLWKGSVTSLFPAFHIRNIIGNLTNMWLGGFYNPGRIGQALQIQKGGTVTVGKTKVTRELAEQLGLVGTGQFGFDIPDVIGKVTEKALGKGNIVSKLNPLERGRQVGDAIESNSKVAFFLDRLSKGDTVEKAVAQTRKYLFDYSRLTDFEKGVMRRVFPFYTWTRNNVPLQVEQLIKQPHKAAAVAKTFSNLTPLTEEEKEALPPYLTEGLSASLGKTPEGELRVLSGFGLPIEDLARFDRGGGQRTFEREVAGATGPLSQLAGLGFNRDFFRGENLDELSRTYGYSAKNYPELIKGLIDYNETEDGTSVVDPYKYAILQMFGSRVLATIVQPEKAVQFAKIKPVDLEKSKATQEFKRKRELEKKLEQKGVMKKFEKYYQPKEKKSKMVAPGA